MNRTQLLRQNQRTPPQKIRLITHNNPRNPNFNHILQDHTGLLLMTRKDAIKPDDIEVTYFQEPQSERCIKGTLNDTQTTKGTTPCGKPRCKTCNHIQTGSKISRGQDTYNIRGSFTCQSRNIVYLLTCNICNEKYVGETEQTLNGRCRGHESNMRANHDNILSKHYKEYNHISEDYAVTTIDKESDYNKRLRLEEAWIIVMDSMHPKGLNSRM